MTGAVTYDFFSDATRDDPFALFHQLREHDPVYETDFGYWYVSRYDDVVRLLRDTRSHLGPWGPRLAWRHGRPAARHHGLVDDGARRPRAPAGA